MGKIGHTVEVVGIDHTPEEIDRLEGEEITIARTVEETGIDHIPDEIDRLEGERITIAPMEEVMTSMRTPNRKDRVTELYLLLLTTDYTVVVIGADHMTELVAIGHMIEEIKIDLILGVVGHLIEKGIMTDRIEEIMINMKILNRKLRENRPYSPLPTRNCMAEGIIIVGITVMTKIGHMIEEIGRGHIPEEVDHLEEEGTMIDPMVEIMTNMMAPIIKMKKKKPYSPFPTLRCTVEGIVVVGMTEMTMISLITGEIGIDHIQGKLDHLGKEGSMGDPIGKSMINMRALLKRLVERNL